MNKKIEKKYCVQYRETDLDFIARIIAEEGIYYFFEHDNYKHRVVFADGPIAHINIGGEPEVIYNPTNNMVAEKECIYSIDFSQRICSDAFTHTNFNFKQPSVDLEVKHQTEAPQQREVYDYPANCGDSERGSVLAKIRLQEKTAFKDKVEGSSNCSRFIPGFTYILSDHDINVFNCEYLLVEVKHFGQQPQSLEENAADGVSSYSNSFTCIPYSVNYRPVRIEKPFIKGLQSAIVVGPPGEEIYPDQYGRVKVQFHWDREGQRNEKSSCWLRIGQTWSGNGWGMITIPRIGDEVLVDFIEGDPDRPIIVGSVNNAESPALYSLPANKTQSGIRTRSYPNGGTDNFHELRFEDKKGSEEIYLQSEKDWNILVKNDKTQNVGHDEALHVANNRLKTVGVDQMVQVGANHTETIGANKSISVGSNKTEMVGINSAETVGLAKELTIGGLYQVSVGGVMNETVIGAKAEEVGVTKAVLVGAHMTEKVAGNRSLTVGQNLSATVSQNTTVKAKAIILEADDEIIFKTGSSTISLKSSGEIVVTGATITEKASGEIVIKGAKTSVN